VKASASNSHQSAQIKGGKSATVALFDTIGDRQDGARDIRPTTRSAASACSISWNCNSKTSSRKRARRRLKRERANPARGHLRRPATRRNFPDHLPRRRIVHPTPTCCGGDKLSKIGEDVTDVMPRQMFVTQHVREKFSCRSCDKISQPPAPFHTRCFADPSLLAMILVDSSAAESAERAVCARGHRASVSTMAGHVGACAASLLPLFVLIKHHVFAAERLHGDDTTAPVMAKRKTRTGWLWTYARDDRPFGGDVAPLVDELMEWKG
jgi:transposase